MKLCKMMQFYFKILTLGGFTHISVKNLFPTFFYFQIGYISIFFCTFDEKRCFYQNHGKSDTPTVLIGWSELPHRRIFFKSTKFYNELGYIKTEKL